MSWLFSQALVAEYLGENFLDGEPSAPSNGSHTQLAYLPPDKMTAFSRLSRFGMTYKPLTESRGEELLTLYLAGFHAKTSQQQEREMAWTVMGAADVGANHQRDRIWILAYPSGSRRKINESAKGSSNKFNSPGDEMDNSNITHGKRNQCTKRIQQEYSNIYSTSKLADTQDKGNVWRQWIMGFVEQEHDQGRGQTNGSREWWQVEPNVGRVADGVAARVDRLKAIGNGQVPLCAATAWRILSDV